MYMTPYRYERGLFEYLTALLDMVREELDDRSEYRSAALALELIGEIKVLAEMTVKQLKEEYGKTVKLLLSERNISSQSKRRLEMRALSDFERDVKDEESAGALLRLVAQQLAVIETKIAACEWLLAKEITESCMRKLIDRGTALS